MKVLNRISEIIKDRGFCNPRPTQKILDGLGMTSRRFYKILRNEGSEMTILEIRAISKWLKVNQSDIFFEDNSNSVPDNTFAKP